MVDREARNKMAELLRHLASGRITCALFWNEAPRKSKDEAIKVALCHAVDIAEERFPNTEVERAECRFVGDYSLSDQQRRRVGRMVLFLQSNLEYRWGPIKLSWWSALLLAPVLIVGLVLAAALACGCLAAGPVGWILGTGAIALLFYVGNKVGNTITGRDARVWPFHLPEEYEEALTHPKLLAGKSGE